MSKSGGLHIRHDGLANVVVTECGVADAADAKRRAYYAVWDTGAYCTCISPRVVDTLALQAEAEVPNYTAGGLVMSELYYINIELPMGAGRFKCLAANCPLGDVDVLR